MKAISLNDSEKIKALSKDSGKYILYAFPENSLGMIFGDKDMGKSRLMLSAAYSLALNIDLVGLLPVEPKDRKQRRVAIWDSEEGASRLANRLSFHLQYFDDGIAEILRRNITIVDDTNESNTREFLFKDGKTINYSAIESLKQLLNDHDILFIDTIRASLGFGCEVLNDNDIKVILSELAHDAQCSICFLHHIRKSDIEKGINGLNSSSGSGLQRTSSTCRVQYGIWKADKNSDDTTLHILKANNLSRLERYPIEHSPFKLGEYSIPLLKHDHENLTKILTGVIPLEESLKPESDSEKKPTKNQDIKASDEVNQTSVNYELRTVVDDEKRRFSVGKSPKVTESAKDRRSAKFEKLGLTSKKVQIPK